MFSELSDYLRDQISPERYDVLEDLTNALGDINAVEYEDELISLLSTADDKDPQELLLHVTTLITEVAYDTMSQLGVDLIPDAPLNLISDMLRALSSLEDYEDPQRLQALCEAEDGSEDVLATLLAELGAYEEVDYLTYIDSVNGSLVDRIESIAVTEEEIDDVAVAVDIAGIRRRVLDFRAQKELPAIALVKGGVKLGLPIDFLMETYPPSGEEGDVIAQTEELIGLALISNLQDAEVYPWVREQLELYFSEPSDLLKADIYISKVENQGS